MSAAAPPPTTPTILIVDDERSIVNALRRSLGRLGFHVLCAESGEAALALLGEIVGREGAGSDGGHGLPQVVLSDYRMPRMDGVSFLAQVKERWPAIQRVLITGFADLEAIERAVNVAGIYRFVNKPWEELRLLSTVRSAVEQWQAVDENRRLLTALEDHNRRLEEAVQARTAELTQAHRLLSGTFDAIEHPLMVIDEGYRIRRANRALLQHLGLPADSMSSFMPETCHELRARSPFALPRTPEGPCIDCPVAQTRQDGRPAEAEWTLSAGSLALRSFPLDALAVCLYRDVTKERDTARQLALTDRMAAIGQLAGGVAHEVNNPLSGILAFAQLLLRDGVSGPSATIGPAEAREYLGEIESAALRCKKTVEHLLRFSRQAARDEIGPVDLNALVREALPLIEHQYALRGVRVRCALDPDLPEVLGSGAQLQQVLMNLLSNAFDATWQHVRGRPGGGVIEVITACAEGAAVLRVLDQGAGIDEAEQARLFLPFYTTKPEGRGTGLGLSVAYGIVTDHGGIIRAYNRPEGGAEFLVVLAGHSG